MCTHVSYVHLLPIVDAPSLDDEMDLNGISRKRPIEFDDDDDDDDDDDAEEEEEEEQEFRGRTSVRNTSKEGRRMEP